MGELVPAPDPATHSIETEERFRRIFYAQLLADGRAEEDFHRLIFKTPAPFHSVPSGAEGQELLAASREHYQRQLALAWFLEGWNERPEIEKGAEDAPERPVTLVVIPGIFGEFIDQLPFQEVVEKESSRFRRRWQPDLDAATDRVYSLLELEEVDRPLSELVKIGSLDQGSRSFANVIVLNALGGSLETLGTLESNAEVFERRLTKVFEILGDDTDIHLVGYSRGLAVALELVSRLHARAREDDLPETTLSWFARVRGVVGLGGVFYGAAFAHDVLTGKSGATSDLVRDLCATSGQLRTVPEGASLKDKGEVITHNSRVWGHFLKKLVQAETPRVAAGKSFLGLDLAKVFEQESKARILGRDVPLPNPWGIFKVVTDFFLRTFRLDKSISRYNENILALKQLVEAVVLGVHTLTPASRDEWWRGHELPGDLVLLSITGTMPDAHLQQLVSPLWHFDGFGARTSDYNVSLRAAYYDTLHSEGTLINDSQVSHFGSRYWPEMYPNHRYEHHYLGVLGTHHWGMAFPYTIEDDEKIGGNAFPRTTLLRSVAAYLASC